MFHLIDNFKKIPLLDFYYANQDGEIECRRFPKWKRLKQHIYAKKLAVRVQNKGRGATQKWVGELVMSTFGGKRPHPKAKLYYRDGNIHNNKFSNLYWRLPNDA